MKLRTRTKYFIRAWVLGTSFWILGAYLAGEIFFLFRENKTFPSCNGMSKNGVRAELYGRCLDLLTCGWGRM